MQIHDLCDSVECISATSSLSSDTGKRDIMGVSFLCEEDSAKEEEHFCKRCLVAFPSKKQLQRHTLSVHRSSSGTEAVSSRGYMCPICSRSFSHRHNMKRHVDMVHRNRRPHSCEFCDKMFMTNSCVKRHISRKHSVLASSSPVRSKSPVSS
ncbi:hypothetical protein NDN08_002947 [Rhodosorus marinus]|uniref:C2H2-type domain-containing protein n=1 Tax=Rhodosorus marinus TaxID=101924 RepID=A0AAV8UVA3_9RHOD|nr:hypothetical protein NDN08_002947 [Rhodosorus marinus]